MKKSFINFYKNSFVPSVLFLLFFLTGGYVKSQIVYMDVNPDITGSSWNLDMMGTTFAQWGGGNAFATSPYNLSNKRCMVTTSDNAAILDAGGMIAPTNNWNGDAWNIGTITDKYLGVRIGTTGDYRYGWIKVSRTAAGVWTIQSYAYQNTVNTAIAAGDMGSGTGNVAVTGITVNGQGGASTIGTAGGTLQMLATVAPANATNQNVTWSVQNGTGTASISATGMLTAQSDGMVTVRATAQDGSGVSGTKDITISGQTVAVTGITVSGQGGASTIGTAGGTLQMLATVAPANATNQNVTWSVQNGTGTASISATGLLTAQSDGMVTVKATAQDGSGVSGTKVITLSSATAGITAQNLLASKCFPNPVDQALTLNFEQPQTIHGIRIINMAGQEVYKDGKTKQGTSINIPTATLQAGTYLLVFEDATGRQGIEKFVKQ